MSDRTPVLINAGGGAARRAGDDLRAQVEAAFEAAGVAIDLHLVDGGEIAARAKQLGGAPVVVVGGGDGTLGSAAGELAGSGTALGILPLGTRNHLAGALGVPADLPGAAKLIAERPLRRIDLARVNDRPFVNNASIGLYPAMVRFREAAQERGGLSKKLAALPAALAALKRIRHHRLRLRVAGETREVVTPMLFVGNNRYVLDRGHLGERAALDDGKLSVFAVGSHQRRALIGFALRAILGRAGEQDFAAVGDAAELIVSGRSRAVSIALDGELLQLSIPLHFRIEPLALTVIAPPAA